MSTLIIAEKPALAKDIANAISFKSHKVGNDYFECPDGTRVVWLFGHLLTLKEPEDYDKKYTDHSDLTLLPIWFDPWETKVASDDKASRVKLIGKLLKEADQVSCLLMSFSDGTTIQEQSNAWIQVIQRVRLFKKR